MAGDKDKKTKVGNNDNQVGKHLTEMKELPEYSEDQVVSQEKVSISSQESSRSDLADGSVVTEDREQKIPLKKQIHDKKKVKRESGGSFVSNKFPLSMKDIILGIINLVSIALLVILLSKLPEKAQRLKDLRNERVINQSSISFELSDISESNAKADELEKYFIDESGVVEFVNDVEDLRSEESSITEVRFTSQKAVKDKTGNYGIPIAIELRGGWQQIGEDLQDIQQLPYLFRPVKIEAEPLEDAEGLIQFSYGGFLYVNDELGEN